MTKLLIFTTGQTDVQVVIDGKRHALAKRKCGYLLDQIVRRTYTLCDAPSEKASDPIDSFPEGELLVCTPKLDAVLRYFKGQLPQAVLILETGRSFEDDPRQAGAVLEQRLRERGVQQVSRQMFLKEREQLEDSKNESDAVVRREVVCRLTDAIANVFATRSPTHVYNALAGGIPEANDVISEIVRLYAIAIFEGCQVTSLKVPDGTKVKQDDRSVPEPFHPAAGIRARWQALSLIQKGNLLAAWGAVEHIKDEPGQEWIRVVEWLACFASSLPMPAECDIPVLTHNRIAVHAALRVELALRARDIPRAVLGTVAFFESALWDWLRQRDFAREDQASGKLETGFTFSQNPIGEKSKRFREYTHNRQQVWKIDDFRKGVTAWLNVLNKSALSNLQNALSDDIRELRNDVAHNEPTPQRINSALCEMQQAGLWSTDDPPAFLSQPLVQNVLKELGVDQPDSLCKTLLETVCNRLLPSS
jgi:hypothetical protein